MIISQAIWRIRSITIVIISKGPPWISGLDVNKLPLLNRHTYNAIQTIVNGL